MGSGRKRGRLFYYGAYSPSCYYVYAVYDGDVAPLGGAVIARPSPPGRGLVSSWVVLVSSWCLPGFPLLAPPRVLFQRGDLEFSSC